MILGDDDIGAIVAAVWNEVLNASTHNVTNSAGKRLRLLPDAFSFSVNDTAATTTSFVTTLTNATDHWYEDKVIEFTSGALNGLTRVISEYIGATKTVKFDEPLPSAPADNVTFDLLTTHTHPITKIAHEVVAEEIKAGGLEINQAQLAKAVTGQV